MDNTYITVYENETRSIEILVRDQYDEAFNPDTATVLVEDIVGDVVVAEANAMVYNNTVSTIISTDVTSILGEYHIIWKIVKGTDIFYHKSIINVKEL